MHVDPALIVGGLVVGFSVGLTGMGGGALATPMLILLFRVPALAAVGSDLVASLVMKPFGGAVHWRSRTVRTDIVRWLALASVPAAFVGVLVVHVLGSHVDGLLRRSLGLALLASAGCVVLRSRISRLRAAGVPVPAPTLRRGATLAIGAFGGFLVGMTSVGSGSIVMVLLLVAYPGLRTAELVGTDLVQAVPLVGAAALAHLLFGEVRLAVTASLVLGAVPGVLAGARLSARAPERLVKPALFAILVTTGLKLVAVP